LAAVVACWSGLAVAQTPDPVAAERMERAKRDAANPLRMIIEAANKAKPKGPEAAASAPAPTAAAAPAVRTARPAEPARGPAPTPTPTPTPTAIVERVEPLPQARPAATAAASATTPTSTAGRPTGTASTGAAPAGTASTGTASVAGSSAGNPAAAGPGPAGTNVAAPSAGAPAAGTLAATPSPLAAGSTAGLQQTSAVTPAGGATPGVAAAVLPAAVATTPPPGAVRPAVEAALSAPQQRTPVAAAARAEAPLKLARYVEPDIPGRIRNRLRANNEVTVVFRVNADGSVSDPEIRNTSSKLLDTVVLDAVKQWRYEPISESRIHAVQMVFNLDN